MIIRIYSGFIIFFLVWLIVGCTRGSPTFPTSDDSQSDTSDLSLLPETGESENYHYPLIYNLIYITPTDPGIVDIEVVPLRDTMFHLNILKFLEVAPCTDCFKLVGIFYPEPGTINVDIEITHPFDDPLYTAFDVRGIIMYNGNRYFPYADKLLSDPDIGDGALLNPDGYTSLYNGSTLGIAPGDLTGYFQGKLATPEIPDSDINGYIRHISDDPANTRNALYAGDSVTRMYSLKFPSGAIVLGYAVDASWSMPIVVPVDDPMTDFGPEANCPEPWKIDVTQEPVGDGMTYLGGETKLTIDVYDWQGMETHQLPIVECPELFSGIKLAQFITPGDTFNRFEVTVANQKLVDPGNFRCLVSVEDNENNPDLKPWLDLTSYQVIELTVNTIEGKPYNPEIVTPGWLKNQPRAVSLDGNIACWSGGSGTTIADLTNPAKPIAVGWLDLKSAYDNLIVSDGYLYIDANPGMSIFDIDPPESAHIVSVVNDYGLFYAKLGNIAFTEKSGEAYIFDVSTPENPVMIGNFTLPVISTLYKVIIMDGMAYVLSSAYFAVCDIDPPESAHVVGSTGSPWSTWGKYFSIEGNYAFLTRPFEGMAIVDFSNPENPFLANTLSDVNFWDIEIKDGYGYAAMNDGGLAILDVDPPMDTHQIGTFEMARSIYSVDITGDLLALGRGVDGLRVMDISQPESPSEAGNFWVCGISNVIRYHNGYVYITNSHATYLRIIDVDPYETAQVVAILGEDVYGGNFGDMAIAGNYLIAAVGYSQIWIIDITDPENPLIVKVLDGFNGRTRVDIAGDYAYIGDAPHLWSEKPYVHIYDISSPENAFEVASVIMGGGILTLAVNGDYVYAGIHNDYILSGLQIIDINPPESAHIIATNTEIHDVEEFAISGNYLYLKNAGYSLDILDINPPEDTWLIKTYPYTNGYKSGMAISGGYLYITGGDFEILDLSTPLNPLLVTDENITSKDISISDNFAYLAMYGPVIVKLW